MWTPSSPSLRGLLAGNAAAAALALAAAAPAQADPGYYVVTPYSNEGLRLVDVRYWTTKARGDVEYVWPEFGLGYGFTSRWTSELFASWIRASNLPTRISTWNWQNDVLLTQGEWPIDVALHLQLIRDAQDSHARAVEWGPVLQTDVGRLQVNANLFFERTRNAAGSNPTQAKYQWQLRHRTWHGVHLGAQGFGELGDWDDPAPRKQQSHRAGPAAFGTWYLSDRQALKLQAAWLVGKTYGQAGRMFTLRAHAEF